MCLVRRMEKSAPMFISSLQAQLGDDVQPAQMLTDQDPTTGDVARAWSLYVNFMGVQLSESAHLTNQWVWSVFASC